MAGQILSKSQLHDVIYNNHFKIEENDSLVNLNELALLTKTAVEYGFEIDEKKAQKIVRENLKVQKNTISLNEKYEGAVLQIRGEYSVKPEFSMSTEEGFIKGKLFIFQATITNKLHRILAKNLLEEKVVVLFPGCDEEYLYQALSDVTETYLHETLAKVAKNLPIFHVDFDEDGTFKVKEMGNV